ncbi:hypothetical protein VTK73DRAFT_9058 [Phialemonium thermophilum]|uniref:chitinase n=1 Tax=Phialemonium thermophilum TaxID=223376 RepID=A0ABR3W4Y2_9PEZI
MFGLLCLVIGLVLAQPGRDRPLTSQGRCPAWCGATGPDPQGWDVFQSLQAFESCDKSILFDFAIHNPVEPMLVGQKIRACSVWGGDFALHAHPAAVNPLQQLQPQNVTLEKASLIAPGHAGEPVERLVAVRTLQRYVAAAADPLTTSTIVFATSGRTVVGLYIGAAIDTPQTAASILEAVSRDVRLDDTSLQTTVQLCGSDRNADQTLGFVSVADGNVAAAHDAVRAWASGQCLRGTNTTSSVALEGWRVFPAGPASIANHAQPTVAGAGGDAAPPSALPASLRGGAVRGRAPHLHGRSSCKTTQVVSGDGCASLAKRCGISAADFTKFNPSKTLCSTLQPGQHVCCSSGSLPDFKPKPNHDGSCAQYTIVSGDSCSAIAGAHSLSISDLETFNKKTWGWSGCALLYVGNIICLSQGTPPMPAPLSNAVCGPQVPGTSKPKSGVDLSTLNPCPLKACCDVWGQCGTTAEFCTNTSTGAPGTAKKGTNGCISNCGTDPVIGNPPAEFKKVAYFEGFNLNRDCLYMDASQLAGSDYTHVHYAFAGISSDFQAVVGATDNFTSYEFEVFRGMTGFRRIVSFGGWTFSTDPKTYTIFREGVKPANRDRLASSIASFATTYGLDGVDIDWEYPGAPDIPGIPPASQDDGPNYLAFLKSLKQKLGSKSLSIAAPASYWYLKGFPIAEISKTVDYIVYMTYDLHGLWDFGNAWSDVSCPGGNCLRSHINFTETINAISMITKAGVPSNMVVAGVTSYGRSFQMTDPACSGPMCTWVKTATPGRCTKTAGYLGDAEIKDIIKNNRDARQLKDDSGSNILIYDKNQWVSWMDSDNKKGRTTYYQSLFALGGTSDWAVDLEDYRATPKHLDAGAADTNKAWAVFKERINEFGDPYAVGPRTGNWTQIPCTSPATSNVYYYTPEDRWRTTDAAHAWQDALTVWETIDKPQRRSFVQSVSNTLHAFENLVCMTLATEGCADGAQCHVFAAGYLVYNSLVQIYREILNLNDAISRASVTILADYPAFADKFAPIVDHTGEFYLLIDIFSMAATVISAPMFNNWLSRMAYFVEHEASLNNIRDVTYGLIGQVQTLVKDLYKDKSKWNQEVKDNFQSYIGHVLRMWENATETLSHSLFDGTAPSVDVLTGLISDGKLLDGDAKNHSANAAELTLSEMVGFVERGYYGFIIPQIWNVSSTVPFVMDTGYACGTINPMSDYLGDADAAATYVCHAPTNKMYYLVSVRGSAQNCNCGVSCTTGHACLENKFVTPPGLEHLDGSSYGGVTRDDLVYGAIATYQANGRKNGATLVDPYSKSTYDQLWAHDIRSPGYVSIPVCSASEAHLNWLRWSTLKGFGTSNFPCT